MPRRSPIIFWLLLAATVAVDLVAVIGIFNSSLSNHHTLALYLSMAYAQINLLCLWSVSDRKLIAARWMVPVCAGLLVSAVLTWADASDRGHLDLETFTTVSCMLLLHVGLVLSVTWFVLPWAWISSHAAPKRRRRQFSTLQLLILMTCVAVFLSALRLTNRFDGEWIDIATFCFANAILLCVTLAVLQARGPLPLRLAACLLVAICISAITSWTHVALTDELNAWAFFIIQTIVIALWLCYYSPAQNVSGADPESILPLGIA